MGQTVTVDNDFARFGSKSYAMNKINSVEVREKQPHGKGAAYAWFAIGLFILIGALGSMASPEGPSGGMFVVAAICLGLGYWQWQRAKIREYHLFLMTSSSEAQAFITRDEAEVMGLRDGIEAAMVRHSQGGLAA
jgi:hypothetical protein